jgi:DNA relaxase NicK
MEFRSAMSNHKVDWLSISLPLNSFFSPPFDSDIPIIRPSHRDEYPHLSDWLSCFPDVKVGGGNRIFSNSVYSKIGGFHVWYNPNKEFSLVEIEGDGVQILREHKMLSKFIKLYGDRLTRLDLATDWETSTTPRQFHECRDIGRFVSHSEINSQTGETCYVGSKESDRYARVYRYAEGHPRSHLLRCEFVLRRDNAKAIAGALQSVRVSEVAGRLFNTFGYRHFLTTDHSTTEKMRAAPRPTSMGGTERWLFVQVFPAIKKVLDSGNFAIIDMFMENVYDEYQIHLKERNKAHGEANLCADVHSTTP